MQEILVILYLIGLTFWKECVVIVHMIEPIVCVWHIVDSEKKKTFHGLFVKVIDKARSEFLKQFKEGRRRLSLILRLLILQGIDNFTRICMKMVIGWILIYYNSEEIRKQRDIVSRLIDVIERNAYEHCQLGKSIRNEMIMVKDIMGDFRKFIALVARARMTPDKYTSNFFFFI